MDQVQHRRRRNRPACSMMLLAMAIAGEVEVTLSFAQLSSYPGSNRVVPMAALRTDRRVASDWSLIFESLTWDLWAFAMSWERHDDTPSCSNRQDSAGRSTIDNESFSL